MVDCHEHDDGFCMLAKRITGKQIDVPVDEDTCKACLSSDKPRSANKATCGLALVALAKGKQFDRDIHRHIVECAATVYSRSLSEENRPGLALRNILHTLGIQEPANCYCEEYASAMDAWGWQGCIERKKEIVEHLNAQRHSWFDIIKVAAAGYFSTASLVNEALRRAKPK